MNFMPARQWFPSLPLDGLTDDDDNPLPTKTQDDKQLWYGKDRSVAERNFAEESYIREIEKLKKDAA